MPGTRHAGLAAHRAAPVVRQLAPQLGHSADRGSRQLAAFRFAQQRTGPLMDLPRKLGVARFIPCDSAELHAHVCVARQR
ncbi:MAG: hypothetical protein ABI895_06150 [Deltaproteobacteria bacterium]